MQTFQFTKLGKKVIKTMMIHNSKNNDTVRSGAAQVLEL